MTTPITCEIILNSPTASYWLKKAVNELLDVEPFQAANEAEALAQAMRERSTREIRG